MNAVNVDVPQYGQLCQLAPDLYWARFTLPFRLNHINLYMLDTDDGWCLIDAGVNDEDTARHWQQLLTGPLSHQPVCRLVITHHHVDHIGYAGELARRFSIPMEMTAAEAEHAQWLYGLSDPDYQQIAAEHYQHFGVEEEHIQAVATSTSRFRRLAAPFAPITLLKAGDSIQSTHGLWHIRTDRGHSDEHISLTDTDRQLMIGGDFLLPRISPNISADIRDRDEDLLSAYFTYLEEMQHLSDEMKVFPGHDWPFTHAGMRAAELIAHHHQRLEQLCTAARHTDITTSDAIDILFGRRFGDHELYFASGEARAHLNYLVAHHRMEKTELSGQPDRFRLI